MARSRGISISRRATSACTSSTRASHLRPAAPGSTPSFSFGGVRGGLRLLDLGTRLLDLGIEGIDLRGGTRGDERDRHERSERGDEHAPRGTPRA